jgi:secreted PhoX family phosphatase
LLNRFCSATLSDQDGLYDAVSKTGYEGHVYFAGEEGGDESRAFAANMAGELVQLPRLGLASWENLVPANKTGRSTVVIGLEDGSAVDSQLWMYLGQKTKKGTWFERAGLNNGKNYVLSAASAELFANDNEFRTKYGKNKPVAVSFTEVDWRTNGVTQNTSAREKGVELARVEDGHFDPNNPNDFYFVTTESNKDPIATAPNPATPTVSRDGGALWRLRFVDVKAPLKGATLEMLLNGGEEPFLSKPDNIVVDDSGNVLIQEDPGNNALVARIVAYNISSKKIAIVAKFKDEYFAAGGSGFITQDEESSGIVEVTEFVRTGKTDKAKYYLYVAQIHATAAKSRPDLDTTTATWLPQAVEGGQWYIMKIENWSSIFGG